MKHLAALRYLTGPLQMAPLMLVAIFSLLLLFGLNLQLPGLPVVLIVGSWFFKYAFMLLDHLAEGRPAAPVLSPEVANPLGEVRPLAYGIAIAMFYVASSALGAYLGPDVVSGLRLLALSVLPAIVAIQTVTGSFRQALNPRAIVAMIRRLGVGYLLLLCVAIGSWAIGRAIVLDDAHLSLLLRLALLMLLWLSMFSLLGGVIHEQRLELGFEPEGSPERRQQRADAERDRERDRFMDRIFGEYRSGALRNAWESIRQRATQSPSPLAEYAWMYERVAAWPNPRLAERLAQEMLPLLLVARRTGEALRIAKGRLQADAAFRPLSREQLLTLVELARDGGDRPLAQALLQDFDSRFPNDAARERAARLQRQLAR